MKNQEASKGYFRVVLHTGNRFDFHDSGNSDIADWFESLNYLSEYYSKKNSKKYEIPCYFSEEKYKISNKTMLFMMKQQDEENSQLFKNIHDYRSILDLKNVTRYINKIGMDVLEDRLVFCAIKKCSAQSVEVDIDEEELRMDGCPIIKHDNKILLPKANSLSKQKFAIMVTRKDINYTDKDNDILDINNLPPWMEMECMYIFSWNDDKDDAKFEQKIHSHEMLFIEDFNDSLLSKQGYSFKVELANKVLFFDCPSALHCWKWITL